MHEEAAIGLFELAGAVGRALIRTLAAVSRPTGGRRAWPASIRLRMALVRAGGEGTAGARSEPRHHGPPRFLLAPAFGEGRTVTELLWRIERPSTLIVRIHEPGVDLAPGRERDD